MFQVQGMTELNGCEPVKIKVLGPYTFSIGNTLEFGDFVRGGIATQVKMPKTVSFKSLEEAELAPEYVFSDFAKFDHPPQIHLAFRALQRFNEKYQRNPKPWNAEDSQEFLAICRERAAEFNVDELKVSF